MDDKTLDLWRQIENSRRANKGANRRATAGKTPANEVAKAAA